MRFASVSLTMAVIAASFIACGSDSDGQTARGAETLPATTQQASLPPTLCDLLPEADAERIMGKALDQKRNDNSGCHYQDARGTEGTGLWLHLNAFAVSDQCRLTRGSEPLSGVGSEACIAVGQPSGLYTTVVFRGGGRTFEVTAPGQDKASELATPIAKVVLSKVGS